MKKFYLDKQFKSGMDMGEPIYTSYESGAYDEKYFETFKEALEYAKENEIFLDENETFIICKVEDEE